MATVSLTVTAVNDAPVASDGSATTDEDTAVAITLAGTDIDSDTLTYTVVTGPTHGTLSGTAPNLTYTPRCQHQRRGQLHLHRQRRRGGFQRGDGVASR